MRFLFANKFYYEAGGQEVYLNELAGILGSHGHEVVPFAMKHPKNWESAYEQYFVTQADLSDTSVRGGLLKKAALLPKLIYSAEAASKIADLADRTRPDIAHLFSIAYQLTPSIIKPLVRRGVPIVVSVNEYKLVCPNQRLYIQDRRQVCEKCLGSRYYNAPLTRCIKGSFVASAVGALETYLYEAMGTFSRDVDMFIVATDFMGGLLKGVGIPPERITKLPNPLRIREYMPSYEDEGYIMYFGRLSSEKGVNTLIDAVRKLPDVKLKVVGDGPDEPAMKKAVAGWGADNIEFTGPVWGEGLKELLAGARFVVVPSEWYENSPYVICQSFAMGKPVIGSNISGGIPELVKDGRNGFLFEACDAADLSEKIKTLYFEPGLASKMGMNARADAEAWFGEESSYRGFMEVYNIVLGRRAA